MSAYTWTVVQSLSPSHLHTRTVGSRYGGGQQLFFLCLSLRIHGADCVAFSAFRALTNLCLHSQPRRRGGGWGSGGVDAAAGPADGPGQPSARLPFCCTPLLLKQVFPYGWRGDVSKMTVSPTARPGALPVGDGPADADGQVRLSAGVGALPEEDHPGHAVCHCLSLTFHCLSTAFPLIPTAFPLIPTAFPRLLNCLSLPCHCLSLTSHCCFAAFRYAKNHENGEFGMRNILCSFRCLKIRCVSTVPTARLSLPLICERS